MKNFYNLFFISFISVFYLIKTSEVLSFQLNYYKTEHPLSSYLYTKLKIGDSGSIIYSYISSKEPLFSMQEVIHKLNEEELSTYYNKSLSQTFKNISSLGYKFVTSDKDIHAQEKFIFNLYNNKTKEYREVIINDMDFVLGVKTFKLDENIYYMNIGFPIIRSGSIRDTFYFISQLKQKNIIEAYDWFIYFENEKQLNKDEIFNVKDISNINSTLIIGGTPHYYKNNLFYKSQLLTTYTEVYSWTIKFKDIYIYKNEETEEGEKQKASIMDKTIEIRLDDFKIYGPSQYIYLVKTEFFNKYSSCHQGKGTEKSYYCEKSDDFSIQNLKLFPTLYLEHYEFNYLFELTYEDLFIEDDEKFIFLVNENNGENWLMGYSFLKKYQFVFNEDSKTIGFYNPNLPKETDDVGDDDTHPDDTQSDDTQSDDTHSDDTHSDDTQPDDKGSGDESVNNNNENISVKTVILIVVICGIIIIALSLLVVKLLLKNRNKKPRANELDESYAYNSYENPSDRNIN